MPLGIWQVAMEGAKHSVPAACRSRNSIRKCRYDSAIPNACVAGPHVALSTADTTRLEFTFHLHGTYPGDRTMQNRKGFTLIELLIVVVIIGILAAIAIPKFANTKEKAYLASMKSDLRNLATTQESYFADFQVYTGGIASNIAGTTTSLAGFVPSSGVTATATSAGGTGWSATSTHTATSKTCGIFIGTPPGSPGAPVVVEGEPKCQ